MRFKQYFAEYFRFSIYETNSQITLIHILGKSVFIFKIMLVNGNILFHENGHDNKSLRTPDLEVIFYTVGSESNVI